MEAMLDQHIVGSTHRPLKAQLEARGFEVITTRPDIGTDLSVYNRGTASKGCDVFISLHSNAVGSAASNPENIDYPVVYRAFDNLNDVDSLSLKLAKQIGALMGTHQAGRTATRKNSAGPAGPSASSGAPMSSRFHSSSLPPGCGCTCQNARRPGKPSFYSSSDPSSSSAW